MPREDTHDRDENERARLEIVKLRARLDNRCEICGSRPANAGVVHFRRNVGMFFARQVYEVKAKMCSFCLHKQFAEYTILNLMLGWFGTISFVATLTYFVGNVRSYLRALGLVLKSRASR